MAKMHPIDKGILVRKVWTAHPDDALGARQAFAEAGVWNVRQMEQLMDLWQRTRVWHADNAQVAALKARTQAR